MCDGLLYGYKQNRRGEWFAGAASQTQSPKRLMRVARLHQQSSHRQQHSCCSRATSPYLLTFPLTFFSLPSLSPYAERRGRRDRNLFSLHLIVAPSWLAGCAAARSAAVPRHSTSGICSLTVPPPPSESALAPLLSLCCSAVLLLLRYNRQLRSCCKSQTKVYPTLEPPHHP